MADVSRGGDCGGLRIFFGISFLLGITNLLIMTFTKKSMLLSYRIRELTIINNLSLLAGLALMATGTFLGAVWANESWGGRYWGGWDPKETWALITIVVYSIVTHIHLIKSGITNGSLTCCRYLHFLQYL